MVNDRAFNSVPVVGKISTHNKCIEKERNFFPLEAVQSQSNPKDGLTLHPVKSGGASP
jgi:hypothetical protein